MGILHQSAREEGPTCEIIYYAFFRREHDAKAFLLQRRGAVALELSRLWPMMQERGRQEPDDALSHPGQASMCWLPSILLHLQSNLHVNFARELHLVQEPTAGAGHFRNIPA